VTTRLTKKKEKLPDESSHEVTEEVVTLSPILPDRTHDFEQSLTSLFDDSDIEQEMTEAELKLKALDDTLKTLGTSVQEFLTIQTTGRPQIVVAAQPLPTFNGDSRGAAKWLREYNALAEDNGYSAIMKWSRVRNSLSGNAKSWFKLTVQRDASIDDWDKFVTCFQLEFMSEITKRALRQKLLGIEQGANEMPLNYLYRVQGMCLEYDAQITEETIFDYVLRGLNTKYRESLALSGKKSLAEASRLFRVLQEDLLAFSPPPREKPKTKKGDNRNVKVAQTSPRPEQKKGDSRSPKRRNTRNNWSPTCFNCGVKGHFTGQCSQPTDQSKVDENRRKFLEAKAAKQVKRAETAPNSSEKTTFISKLAATDSPPITAMVELPGAHKMEAILDTGADQSVISKGVHERTKLKLRQWPKGKIRMADGSLCHPLGITRFTFKLGGKALPVTTTFIVSDMEGEEMLLGREVLAATGMVIDMDAKVAGTKPDYLRYLHGKQQAPACELTEVTCPDFGPHQAVVKLSTVLSPLSGSFVPLADSAVGETLFSPCTLRCNRLGTSFPPSILPDGQDSAMIYNQLPVPITLNKGVVVGDLLNTEEFDLLVADHRTPPTLRAFRTEVTSPRSLDTDSLRISDKCSGTQRRQVVDLCQEFSDIFSAGPKDLGVVPGVRHSLVMQTLSGLRHTGCHTESASS